METTDQLWVNPSRIPHPFPRGLDKVFIPAGVILAPVVLAALGLVVLTDSLRRRYKKSG